MRHERKVNLVAGAKHVRHQIAVLHGVQINGTLTNPAGKTICGSSTNLHGQQIAMHRRVCLNHTLCVVKTCDGLIIVIQDIV